MDIATLEELAKLRAHPNKIFDRLGFARGLGQSSKTFFSKKLRFFPTQGCPFGCFRQVTFKLIKIPTDESKTLQGVNDPICQVAQQVIAGFTCGWKVSLVSKTVKRGTMQPLVLYIKGIGYETCLVPRLCGPCCLQWSARNCGQKCSAQMFTTYGLGTS